MFFLILSFNFYLIWNWTQLIFLFTFYRIFLLILKMTQVILGIFICHSLLNLSFLKNILFLN